MKKIKIGILGAYRGTSMINYCKAADHAQIVAICDQRADIIALQQEQNKDFKITYYDNFDSFIKHDMDAVILANYANEHAPFAIKAMNAGKHVLSEVVPVQTMQEAAALIDASEKTGMIYAYGENYCYMPAPYEMRRLYRQGKIGEFEYGECEYLHNCESIWHSLTYGDKNHWRNNMYATFYCTHSLGPIIHITGLRPVSVVGFEATKNERNLRVGQKGGQFGIEMVTLENGGIVKSIHGSLYRDSIWYSVYGSKGRMESAREDACAGDIRTLYVNADKFSGEYSSITIDAYMPKGTHDDKAAQFSHGGSDFYSVYHFVEKLLGNENADIIDVYEAIDMFLPGMFAYRSILAGGLPMEIPDFRDQSVREQYKNDTACTDFRIAKDMLLPVFSRGTPQIDDGIYEYMRQKWRREFDSNGTGTYTKAAFSQGRGK